MLKQGNPSLWTDELLDPNPGQGVAFEQYVPVSL